MTDEYIRKKDVVDLGVMMQTHLWTREQTYNAIFCLPSADVAPVVRCKDCIYYQDNNGGYPDADCKWREDETPDANDYCSCGERKDDDIY